MYIVPFNSQIKDLKDIIIKLEDKHLLCSVLYVLPKAEIQYG